MFNSVFANQKFKLTVVRYVAPIRLRETLEDFSPAWKVPAPLEHAFGAALVVVTGEDEVVHQPPVADGPLQVLRRGRRGGLHRQQGSSEVGSDGDFLRRHDLHEIIKQLRERIMLPCGEGEGFLNLSEGVARGEVYMEISDGGTMRRVERGGENWNLIKVWNSLTRLPTHSLVLLAAPL